MVTIKAKQSKAKQTKCKFQTSRGHVKRTSSADHASGGQPMAPSGLGGRRKNGIVIVIVYVIWVVVIAASAPALLIRVTPVQPAEQFKNCVQG